MNKFLKQECILSALLIILFVACYLCYFSFRTLISICQSDDQSPSQRQPLEYMPMIQSQLSTSSDRIIINNNISNISKFKISNSRSIYFQFENSPNNTDFKSRITKILVIYSYNEESWHAQNLQFFIDKVVKPANPEAKFDIDYVFVINGYNVTIEIPKYPNIFVIKRENSGFDLCAWKVAIDKISHNISVYRYYILMNASIRGPFLPNYIKFSMAVTIFDTLKWKSKACWNCLPVWKLCTSHTNNDHCNG